MGEKSRAMSLRRLLTSGKQNTGVRCRTGHVLDGRAVIDGIGALERVGGEE